MTKKSIIPNDTTLMNEHIIVEPVVINGSVNNIEQSPRGKVFIQFFDNRNIEPDIETDLQFNHKSQTPFAKKNLDSNLYEEQEVETKDSNSMRYYKYLSSVIINSNHYQYY